MATPAYATSSELDAVNSILMTVGESPVNTLNTQSPEVAIAQNTLREVAREVLAEGWVFNSEYEVKFTVDQNDQVPLSDAVLQVDASRFYHLDTYNVIRKEGKLYDRYEHRNTFPDESIMYLDVIWMYAFEDIPQSFRDYITTKASRIASMRMVSDLEIAKGLEQDEIVARASAIEYDTRQADYNVFNDNRFKQSYNSYRPHQALRRYWQQLTNVSLTF